MYNAILNSRLNKLIDGRNPTELASDWARAGADADGHLDEESMMFMMMNGLPENLNPYLPGSANADEYDVAWEAELAYMSDERDMAHRQDLEAALAA